MIYETLSSRQQIDVAWLAIAQREEQEGYSPETPELTMMIKNRIWRRVCGVRCKRGSVARCWCLEC